MERKMRACEVDEGMLRRAACRPRWQRTAHLALYVKTAPPPQQNCSTDLAQKRQGVLSGGTGAGRRTQQRDWGVSRCHLHCGGEEIRCAPCLMRDYGLCTRSPTCGDEAIISSFSLRRDVRSPTLDLAAPHHTAHPDVIPHRECLHVGANLRNNAHLEKKRHQAVSAASSSAGSRRGERRIGMRFRNDGG